MDQKKGGAGRGQGRKAADGAKHLRKVSINLTTAQAAKLKTLGGSLWVREQIEKASEPAQPKAPPSPSLKAEGEPRSFKTLDGATIYEPRKMELDGAYNIDHILDNL